VITIESANRGGSYLKRGDIDHLREPDAAAREYWLHAAQG
jgi:hypothetical protein